MGITSYRKVYKLWSVSMHMLAVWKENIFSVARKVQGKHIHEVRICTGWASNQITPLYHNIVKPYSPAITTQLQPFLYEPVSDCDIIKNTLYAYTNIYRVDWQLTV